MVIGILASLAIVQTAQDPAREVSVWYECSERIQTGERTCDLELTAAPAEPQGRSIVMRYECLVRRSVRCRLRSRAPREAWMRERGEEFARRFETGVWARSLRDGEGFLLTYRYPRDGTGFANAPVARPDDQPTQPPR